MIDNSTLTAVQRIMGGIKIKNKHVIDGDILALEQYIQGLLFYDKLVCLDDYKAEYRDSRIDFFPDVLHIRPSEEAFLEALSASKKITESIVPQVEGGAFTDKDFAPFFQQLKMNVTFTWDINTSVYYLTMKMLEDVGGIDIGKYSKLSSMIFDELKDTIAKNDIDGGKAILFDSKGNPITSGYKVESQGGKEEDADFSRQVKTFFAGLNWLSFRTVLYTLVAKNINVDLILHPIRSSFQLNFLSRLHYDNSTLLQPILKSINDAASTTVNKVFSITQPFVLSNELPLFVAWIAEKTKDPHKFVEYVQEMRQEQTFVQARKQLDELEGIINEGDNQKFMKQSNKLIASIQYEMQRILINYKVSTPQGIPLSPFISGWNMTTVATGLPTLPKFNANVKALDFLRDLLPKKGFSSVYRSLIKDLTSIERLGKYHDIITMRVNLDKDAGFMNVKTELPRYAKSKSWWKSPM